MTLGINKALDAVRGWTARAAATQTEVYTRLISKLAADGKLSAADADKLADVAARLGWTDRVAGDVAAIVQAVEARPALGLDIVPLVARKRSALDSFNRVCAELRERAMAAWQEFHAAEGAVNAAQWRRDRAAGVLRRLAAEHPHLSVAIDAPAEPVNAPPKRHPPDPWPRELAGYISRNGGSDMEDDPQW